MSQVYKKLNGWLILSLVLIFLFNGVGYAELSGETTIVAEGIAAGSTLTSRDEALNRALRSMVERALLELIDPETKAQNSQVLEEKIYSKLKEYIKNFKVVSDNEGEGGIYRIKVEGLVDRKKLTEDIKAIVGLRRQTKSRPRVMVIFSELIDGLESTERVTQSEVERAFLEEGFSLVESAVTELIKAKDILLCYEDPGKSAALGRGYGADVVLVGQATSELVATHKAYGVSIFAYQAGVSAKAIRVDTAELLDSGSISSLQRGTSRTPAARRALADAGSNLAFIMMERIVEVWRSKEIKGER